MKMIFGLTLTLTLRVEAFTRCGAKTEERQLGLLVL